MDINKEFYPLILERRSCKQYLPDPLPAETVSAIVEAGRHAPSGMNRQMNHFYVISDPALLDTLTRMVSEKLPAFALRNFHYGSPVLVVVANRFENPTALQDVGCAMENMMLAACCLGVGSCWINQLYHLREDGELRALLAEKIGLSEDEWVCGSLSLGLPDGPLFPGPKAHPGNPVTWITEK